MNIHRLEKKENSNLIQTENITQTENCQTRL